MADVTALETLRGLYDYHWWLQRVKGASPARLPADADFAAVATLRARWDEFEQEQRAFIAGLGEAEPARAIEYKNTEGRGFRMRLAPLLEDVANHATHHRSEIATMLEG